jgi:hypothetical protein
MCATHDESRNIFWHHFGAEAFSASFSFNSNRGGKPWPLP